ncbi:RHS domain-containing protein [Porphyromonas gulae]|uniref:RHS domain-containing protein n=1 Tax=Porphyromonas gulae TaxID=111105 RepID=UPI000AB3B282|nr:RHS domain-containing protein [Porphyromonas gulae]
MRNIIKSKNNCPCKITYNENNIGSFEYDPLGRRISKTYKDKTTRWVWDGNVPLHEWTEEADVTTWLFEEGSFVPCAKLQNGESYSIVTDYLGTPTEMFNSDGEKTWSVELDIYGSVRNFAGRSLSDCPFRYQGSMRMRRQGYTITVSGIILLMRGGISRKTR